MTDPPQQPTVSPGARRKRPTPEDIRAFREFQNSAHGRMVEAAKIWRNGYVMLAAGLSAILALVGTQLADTTFWAWRLTLTVLLGIGIVLVGVALWLTLTIDGGRTPRAANLDEIIQKHNSFAAFQVAKAAAAQKRLAHSQRLAIAGALLGFLGLIATLWIQPPPATGPSPSPSASASPTPSASPLLTTTP